MAAQQCDGFKLLPVPHFAFPFIHPWTLGLLPLFFSCLLWIMLLYKGNQSCMFIGRTDAEAESNNSASWWEELTHWKRPWRWERSKAGGEGDDRGWDGWMASVTWWTWVWVASRSWWWTGKPGVLQAMGSQRAGHGWVTELTDMWVYKYFLESLPLLLLGIPPEVELQDHMVILLNCLKSHRITCSVAQFCPTVCDPWTVAHQAPLAMGFPRQEYWRV